MITVFALYIYAGTALQPPITYWYDVKAFHAYIISRDNEGADHE